MIPHFTDHAANERTFLAWIRTGIAVLGFGFVIEKFNLFLVALASSSLQPQLRVRVERLAGPLGREDGLALMVVGILIIALGGARYLRAAQLIDDPAPRATGSGRIEVIVAGGLALIGAIFCVYVVLA
jgi:inner membrane protein YidH